VCDATKNHSSTAARPIKYFFKILK
jgi:hypothetical protein